MTALRQEWTPARKAELETLWAAGHSAGKIAELMGMPGGRNAVIGKVDRLKLPKRKSSSTVRGEVKAKSASPLRVKLVRINNNALGRNQFAKRREYKVVRGNEEIPPPAVKPVTIMQLRNDQQCRWIIGDTKGADTLYCGSEVERGSYCGYHGLVAYRPPEERQRR